LYADIANQDRPNVSEGGRGKHGFVLKNNRALPLKDLPDDRR